MYSCGDEAYTAATTPDLYPCGDEAYTAATTPDLYPCGDEAYTAATTPDCISVVMRPTQLPQLQTVSLW